MGIVHAVAKLETNEWQHFHFLQWSGFSLRASPQDTYSPGAPLRPVPSIATSLDSSQIPVLLYFLSI